METISVIDKKEPADFNTISVEKILLLLNNVEMFILENENTVGLPGITNDDSMKRIYYLNNFKKIIYEEKESKVRSQLEEEYAEYIKENEKIIKKIKALK